ncbi:hypothetical protein [Bacillus cereus]|uniref:hypothetical protein n=1 Tax=Bacillus cereus TaxID=1396 RepID=UPI001594F9E4|nr:hypothetical protein [Bacillus cereus]
MTKIEYKDAIKNSMNVNLDVEYFIRQAQNLLYNNTKPKENVQFRRGNYCYSDKAQSK